jgi:nitrogen regulatory protein PII
LKGASVKLVLICYNEAIDREVFEALDDVDVEGYTKWTKVLGKGKTSGPHLYSHVWPKANNVVATVVSEKAAATIFNKVREIRKKIGEEGVKAFMWEIEDVT